MFSDNRAAVQGVSEHGSVMQDPACSELPIQSIPWIRQFSRRQTMCLGVVGLSFAWLFIFQVTLAEIPAVKFFATTGFKDADIVKDQYPATAYFDTAETTPVMGKSVSCVAESLGLDRESFELLRHLIGSESLMQLATACPSNDLDESDTPWFEPPVVHVGDGFPDIEVDGRASGCIEDNSPPGSVSNDSDEIPLNRRRTNLVGGEISGDGAVSKPAVIKSFEAEASDNPRTTKTTYRNTNSREDCILESDYYQPTVQIGCQETPGLADISGADSLSQTIDGVLEEGLLDGNGTSGVDESQLIFSAINPKYDEPVVEFIEEETGIHLQLPYPVLLPSFENDSGPRLPSHLRIHRLHRRYKISHSQISMITTDPNLKFPVFVTSNLGDSVRSPNDSIYVRRLHTFLARVTTCYDAQFLAYKRCLSSLQIIQDRAAAIPRCQDSTSNLDETSECIDGMLLNTDQQLIGRIEFDSRSNEMFSAVYFLIIETNVGFYVAHVEVVDPSPVCILQWNSSVRVDLCTAFSTMPIRLNLPYHHHPSTSVRLTVVSLGTSWISIGPISTWASIPYSTQQWFSLDVSTPNKDQLIRTLVALHILTNDERISFPLFQKVVDLRVALQYDEEAAELSQEALCGLSLSVGSNSTETFIRFVVHPMLKDVIGSAQQERGSSETHLQYLRLMRRTATAVHDDSEATGTPSIDGMLPTHVVDSVGPTREHSTWGDFTTFCDMSSSTTSSTGRWILLMNTDSRSTVFYSEIIPHDDDVDSDELSKLSKSSDRLSINGFSFPGGQFSLSSKAAGLSYVLVGPVLYTPTLSEARRTETGMNVANSVWDNARLRIWRAHDGHPAQEVLLRGRAARHLTNAGECPYHKGRLLNRENDFRKNDRLHVALRAKSLVNNFVYLLLEDPEILEPRWQDIMSGPGNGWMEPTPISFDRIELFWSRSNLAYRIHLASWFPQLGQVTKERLESFWASLELENVMVNGLNEPFSKELYYSSAAPHPPGEPTMDLLAGQMDSLNHICGASDCHKNGCEWLPDLEMDPPAVSRILLRPNSTASSTLIPKFFDLWLALMPSKIDDGIWEIRSLLNLTCMGVHRSERRWTIASERCCAEEYLTFSLNAERIINAEEDTEFAPRLSSAVVLRVPAWHALLSDFSSAVELKLIAKIYSSFGVTRIPLSVKLEGSLVQQLRRLFLNPRPEIQWSILPPTVIPSKYRSNDVTCTSRNRPACDFIDNTDIDFIEDDDFLDCGSSDGENLESAETDTSSPLLCFVTIATTAVVTCGLLGIATLYYPHVGRRARRSISECTRPIFLHCRRVWRKLAKKICVCVEKLLTFRLTTFGRSPPLEWVRVPLGCGEHQFVRSLDSLFLKVSEFARHTGLNEFTNWLLLHIGRCTLQALRVAYWAQANLVRCLPRFLTEGILARLRPPPGHHFLNLSTTALERARVAFDTPVLAAQRLEHTTRHPDSDGFGIFGGPSRPNNRSTTTRLRSTANIRLKTPPLVSRILTLNCGLDSRARQTTSLFESVACNTKNKRCSIPSFCPPRRTASVWICQMIVKGISTSALLLIALLKLPMPILDMVRIPYAKILSLIYFIWPPDDEVPYNSPTASDTARKSRQAKPTNTCKKKTAMNCYDPESECKDEDRKSTSKRKRSVSPTHEAGVSVETDGSVEVSLMVQPKKTKKKKKKSSPVLSNNLDLDIGVDDPPPEDESVMNLSKSPSGRGQPQVDKTHSFGSENISEQKPKPPVDLKNVQSEIPSRHRRDKKIALPNLGQRPGVSVSDDSSFALQQMGCLKSGKQLSEGSNCPSVNTAERIDPSESQIKNGKPLPQNCEISKGISATTEHKSSSIPIPPWQQELASSSSLQDRASDQKKQSSNKDNKENKENKENKGNNSSMSSTAELTSFKLNSLTSKQSNIHPIGHERYDRFAKTTNKLPPKRLSEVKSPTEILLDLNEKRSPSKNQSKINTTDMGSNGGDLGGCSTDLTDITTGAQSDPVEQHDLTKTIDLTRTLLSSSFQDSVCSSESCIPSKVIEEEDLPEWYLDDWTSKLPKSNFIESYQTTIPQKATRNWDVPRYSSASSSGWTQTGCIVPSSDFMNHSPITETGQVSRSRVVSSRELQLFTKSSPSTSQPDQWSSLDGRSSVPNSIDQYDTQYFYSMDTRSTDVSFAEPPGLSKRFSSTGFVSANSSTIRGPLTPRESSAQVLSPLPTSTKELLPRSFTDFTTGRNRPEDFLEGLIHNQSRNNRSFPPGTQLVRSRRPLRHMRHTPGPDSQLTSSDSDVLMAHAVTRRTEQYGQKVGPPVEHDDSFADFASQLDQAFQADPSTSAAAVLLLLGLTT